MFRDEELKGFKLVLNRIKENKYADGNGEYLTHKEVRAFARCSLATLPFLAIYPRREEINFLVASLSAPGLNHCDRSFLASRIIKLLEEVQEEKQLDTSSF